MSQPLSQASSPALAVCVFLQSEPLTQAVIQEIHPDRYLLHSPQQHDEFCRCIEQEKQQLDCLILANDATLLSLTNWLHGQAVLLPALILDSEVTDRADSDTAQPGPSPATSAADKFTYHTAEVHLPVTQLAQLGAAIERAIAQFLDLSPTCRLNPAKSTDEVAEDLTAQHFLMLQQRRLSEKLKERLGYLGVYYKRNPQDFFRYLSQAEKQKFLDNLKLEYREIVLHYFHDDGSLNERIDEFVNTAFFADVSVSQVVETHMELMDEISKQLKLEGRSEEVLLDYRLTLIDTIAHLCEMYRRSIPREP